MINKEELIVRETLRNSYAHEVAGMARRMEQIRNEFIRIGASWDLVDSIMMEAQCLQALSADMLLAYVTLGLQDPDF